MRISCNIRFFMLQSDGDSRPECQLLQLWCKRKASCGNHDTRWYAVKICHAMTSIFRDPTAPAYMLRLKDSSALLLQGQDRFPVIQYWGL